MEEEEEEEEENDDKKKETILEESKTDVIKNNIRGIIQNLQNNTSLSYTVDKNDLISLMQPVISSGNDDTLPSLYTFAVKIVKPENHSNVVNLLKPEVVQTVEEVVPTVEKVVQTVNVPMVNVPMVDNKEDSQSKRQQLNTDAIVQEYIDIVIKISNTITEKRLDRIVEINDLTYVCTRLYNFLYKNVLKMNDDKRLRFVINKLQENHELTTTLMSTLQAMLKNVQSKNSA